MFYGTVSVSGSSVRATGGEAGDILSGTDASFTIDSDTISAGDVPLSSYSTHDIPQDLYSLLMANQLMRGGRVLRLLYFQRIPLISLMTVILKQR